MNRKLHLVPALVLAGFLLAVVGLLAEPGGALRPVLVLPFLLVGPGAAWASRLGDWHLVPFLALALALSLALATLVASLLLLLDLWSPLAGFLLLGLAALIAFLVPIPDGRYQLLGMTHRVSELFRKGTMR